MRLSQVDEVETSGPAEAAASGKAFVEPEVCPRADVLEATTFFQLTDGGASD